MLIRFTVKNFLSFHEAQSLLMIRGKEQRLGHHLNSDESGGFKTLRGAVIYGANASGKSNLIEALKYSKSFIANNKKSSHVKSFKLEGKSYLEPSSFDFEFKIDGKAYSYGFESRGSIVIREWLFEIARKNSVEIKEIKLFERHPKTGDKADISFNDKMLKLSAQEQIDLHSAGRITPDDTLFLYHAKKSNIKCFMKPLKWFEEKLLVMQTESYPSPLLEQSISNDEQFVAFLNRLLKAADTGIDHVKLVKLEGDLSKDIPTEIIDRVSTVLGEEESVFLKGPKGRRILISKKSGGLVAERLVAVRKSREGKDIEFELYEESEGTQRLMDLAPFFFESHAPDRVLVIDELDRSLHPKITQMFHDAHFSNNERMNAQLILATHEHYLLDQKFYRRDEIWFVEKNEYGESKIYPLSAYNIRHDKDIEKDYLLGRYGATPYVGTWNA